MQKHLREDRDLIQGARVHERGDVRIKLTDEEMEDLLDCVTEAARLSEDRKEEARLEMLEAKLDAYWEGHFYEPGQGLGFNCTSLFPWSPLFQNPHVAWYRKSNPVMTAPTKATLAIYSTHTCCR